MFKLKPVSLNNGRIISFDIGIKNMAYCVFDVNNKIPKIFDWAVVNMHDEARNQEPEGTCNCTRKNKSTCTNKIKYRKGDLCFCETHARQYCQETKSIVMKKEHQRKELKKRKHPELLEMGEQFGLFDKTKKWLKPNMVDILCKYFLEHCLVSVHKQSTSTASEISLIDIGRRIKREMDKLSYLDTITHVIIENQISPIAGRMKTIQGMLAQYFVMTTPNAHIEFISSINKLKYFRGLVGAAKPEDTSSDANTTQQNSYQQNKKDAISYTKSILETNRGILGEIWQNVFLGSKNKKDDLADCFLQALWYVNKGGKTSASEASA
jgi:Mitochondrial resolvase Ydc2 / RNA splicing MRS1